MAIHDFLKALIAFLLIAGGIALRLWYVFRATAQVAGLVEENRGPKVQSLFGADQWWRKKKENDPI